MCHLNCAGNDPLPNFAGAGSSTLSLLVQKLPCPQRSAAPSLHPLLRQVTCRFEALEDVQVSGLSSFAKVETGFSEQHAWQGGEITQPMRPG